jgi:hypothetical protein
MAQIIKSGPSDAAPAQYLYLFYLGGMNGKNTFHANPVGNLPDRDGGAHFGPVGANHQAFEHLDSLFIAFTDLHMHFDRIADPERGDVEAHVISFDRFKQTDSHIISSTNGQ